MLKLIFLIKRGIDASLEIFFPSKCLGCNISGEILCKNCVKTIKPAEKETNGNIIASYDYKDSIIKNAIWKLKYYNSPYLGRKLGQLLYNELIEEIELIRMFSLGSPIIVIPVPIWHKRKKNRGYNQSEIIAQSFCSCAPKNVFEYRNDIVQKIKNTLPQARLNNKERRLNNIKGAFGLKNDNIRGRTVIVIDDVTTTGGTMNEIVAILKKNGAKKVIGFAVAH